jgi:hypothetical protein
MSENIVVALIAFAGTLLGSYFAQRKSTALVVYRLEQLENKVDKHNSIIERMYKVEQNVCLIDGKIKVANHRIDDLEGKEEIMAVEVVETKGLWKKLQGKSTDDKPVDDINGTLRIGNGSEFYELNTGKTFIYSTENKTTGDINWWEKTTI